MKLKITVHGVAYEVEVEVLDPGEGFAPAGPLPPRNMPAHHPVSAAVPQASAPTAPGGAVTCPIAGTVEEIKCRPGDTVEEGRILLIVEAMKMNTSIAAPAAGKIKSVPVSVGDNVREGQVLVEFE